MAQTGKAQAWKACVRKDSGVQISPSALWLFSKYNNPDILCPWMAQAYDKIERQSFSVTRRVIHLKFMLLGTKGGALPVLSS